MIDALLVIENWSQLLTRLRAAQPDRVDGDQVVGWDATPTVLGDNGGRIVLVRMGEAEAAIWRAQASALGVTIIREHQHHNTDGAAAGKALFAALTEDDEAALDAIYTRQAMTPLDGGTAVTPPWVKVVGVIA